MENGYWSYPVPAYEQNEMTGGIKAFGGPPCVECLSSCFWLSMTAEKRTGKRHISIIVIFGPLLPCIHILNSHTHTLRSVYKKISLYYYFFNINLVFYIFIIFTSFCLLGSLTSLKIDVWRAHNINFSLIYTFLQKSSQLKCFGQYILY